MTEQEREQRWHELFLKTIEAFGRSGSFTTKVGNDLHYTNAINAARHVADCIYPASKTAR